MYVWHCSSHCLLGYQKIGFTTVDSRYCGEVWSCGDLTVWIQSREIHLRIRQIVNTQGTIHFSMSLCTLRVYEILLKYNIHIATEWIPNDVSSTKIR